MIESTFCHLPRISAKTERLLWDNGFHNWHTVYETSHLPVRHLNASELRRQLDESALQLELNNPHHFADQLPSNMLWRLFPDFRSKIAYLDIETTGMSSNYGHVTTIALYDGKNIRYYIYDDNLEEFVRDAERYSILVTYNGKCFDIPFLRDAFNIPLNHVHLDLRYILYALGYKGGLKGCEKQLGIDRGDLDGVDGYFAVLLWNDYRKNRNHKALETLLCYNIQDVLSLELLLIKAYNLYLSSLLVQSRSFIPETPQPDNPFEANLETIYRIQQDHSWSRAYDW